jgi:hypothetical protein
LRRSIPFGRVILVALWALSLLYLWRFVDRGWIPHDDGMLAQIAERVLLGELPHRDFDDPYTGLLGYLHGLGFLILGPSVRSLRLVLFAVTAVWLLAVYRLARRFLPRPGAVLVTALALTWSVPNYFAAVPSYYNLFLATFGMVALVRHVETERRSWLGLAGLCGGLSFLVKSAGGVYFAAAALLFLLYRERAARPDESGHPGPGCTATVSRHGRVLTPLLIAKASSVAVVAVALAGLSPRLGAMELLTFVMPGTLVALVLCHQEGTSSAGPPGQPVARLWALIWPFALGFGLPLLLFLIPYIRSGAVDDFIAGVIVLPMHRFEAASFPLPPLGSVWPALPYAAVLLGVTARRRRLPSHWIVGAAGAVLLVASTAGGGNRAVYQVVWNSARHLGAFAVAAGCVALTWRAPADRRDRQLLFLAVAMAAFMPLLQVPFSAPIYFAYGTPFLVLAVTAVVAGSRAGTLHGALGVTYLLFAVIWMNSSYIWAIGNEYVPYRFVGAPVVKRADIEMLPHERDEYTRLIELVRQTGPRSMLALPDCPEVYFLARRRNPGRYIYEFLAPRPLTRRRVLELLDAHHVTFVVINRSPDFSRLDPAVLHDLETLYPYSAEAGRFLVRWRP